MSWETESLGVLHMLWFSAASLGATVRVNGEWSETSKHEAFFRYYNQSITSAPTQLTQDHPPP
jgi:hypothetical protein